MIPFKVVKMIDVKDFDRLVEDTYKKPYTLQLQELSKSPLRIVVPDPDAEDYENNATPTIYNQLIGVSFKKWLETDPATNLPGDYHGFYTKSWWEYSFFPNLGIVINDLHAKGLLDEGEYYIKFIDD